MVSKNTAWYAETFQDEITITEEVQVFLQVCGPKKGLSNPKCLVVVSDTFTKYCTILCTYKCF